MTMHITPSRSGLAEQVAIKDWQARRYGKTSIPAASMRRLSGLGGDGWKVTEFGATEVTNWDIPSNSGGMGSRRTWKRRIPESSLLGIGSLARHVGTAAERRWGINPLAETTYVENTAPRRVGMDRYYEDGTWREQAMIAGFSQLLGATLDSTVSVREVQTTLRKLGICAPNGRRMAVDGVYGPITESALAIALQRFQQLPGQADATSQYTASTAWRGNSGARELTISSTFWSAIVGAAAGAIDQCGGGGGGSSGGGSSGGGGSSTTTEEPTIIDIEEETAWYQNPLYWLAIAAAGGAAYYLYTQSETNDPFASEF